MPIARPIIDAARAAGACEEAMSAFEGAASIDEFAAQFPEYYRWLITFPVPDLEDATIGLRRRDAVSVAPELSLELRADKLTPAELDACAEREPRQALISAAELVTPERLAWLRERFPDGPGKPPRPFQPPPKKGRK